MKSIFKLAVTSFLTFFCFATAHATTVETDTVMSQNLVETEYVKANSISTESASVSNARINNLTVLRNITMMHERSEGWMDNPPFFEMYSQPYQGAVVVGLGYKAPTDSTSQDWDVNFSATSTIDRPISLNFIAGKYNFNFKSTHGKPGVMNVDGKIVCKEEIRVAEVNTNKVNSDEVNTKGITAKEINVEMDNAADYVFEEGYDLKSLDEVEAFVKSNKHLPGVPSASELKENGMNVSEMSNILLEKVEELTLHLIRLQKEVEQLREENKALKNKR